MKLQSVKIKNFRSIESAEIEFAPKCRALIGINESGKTNVINALSLLHEDWEPEPNDIRIPLPDEEPIENAHVDFVFHFEEEDYSNILESILAEALCDSTEVIEANSKNCISDFVRTITQATYRVNLKTKIKFSAEWPPEIKIKDGWLTPNPSMPNELAITDEDGINHFLHSFKIIHANSIDETILKHCTPLTTESFRKFSSDCVDEYLTDNLPNCVMWSYSDQQLLPASVPLASFAAAPSKYEPLRQMFALAGFSNPDTAISEAQKTETGIRNLLSRVSNSATQHLKDVWKDYKGITIEIEPNGTQIDISIKDSFNRFNFNRRSDGFKRFISFLFLVSAKTKNGTLSNTLYLHDEPDSGLHPSGAKHLLSELIKISKENYVVFSTHSIFMIDRTCIGRHIIVRKETEKTRLMLAESSNFRDEEVLFNALNFSTFELVRRKNILFEGWKDKEMFQCVFSSKSPKYAHVKMKAAQVGSCFAQGVKDIPKVSSILELADREWLVISDGDKVAKEGQKKYSWPQSWKRYDEFPSCDEIVTSEDFLHSNRVASVFSRICDENGVSINNKSQLQESDKLNAIRTTLNAARVDGTTQKNIVSELKDALISELKVSHLRECYFIAIEAALDTLNSNSGRKT